MRVLDDKQRARLVLNMQIDYARRLLAYWRQQIDKMSARDEKNAALIEAARAARDEAHNKYLELVAPGDELMKKALDDDRDEQERAVWHKKWDDWRDRNRWDVEAAHNRYIRLRDKAGRMITDELKRTDLFIEALDREGAAEARYNELCAKLNAIPEETCHAQQV